ncbi:ABC transporter ATP-binding protein [Peptostreptococcus canis]|uniref:ABC transporter ATP-binding protein n=1 Tax=Peptostreptococcus canis TaxID=1159213 RepID=A0ABR6TL33_9FIRM|nr:ABC transporter ATP-binding protein [Peptostreptococcus canis]MBC2575853.1 ABC transporter ATP-binding protein [Peptostreptococcus canis]MBP1998028.1 ATP-binding cassette subfamily B protein [Peptostreptococcus canis]
MKAKNNNKSSNADFIKSTKRLLGYMKNDYIKLIIVAVFSILSTVFMIVGPKIMGNATTEIFNGVMRKISNPSMGINFSKVLKIVIFLVVLYTVSSVFSYLQAYIMSGIAQRVSYNLRKEISEKLNRLPISYFDKNEKGDIISRVTNDVDTLSQSLNQSLMMAVTSVITVVGIFIMMLTINFMITIVAVLLVPITMFCLMMIIRKSQHFFKLQQKYLGKLNGKIEETYSGQNIVRAHNAERFEQLNFNKINNRLYETSWKSQFLSSIMMPMMMLISNVGYVVVAILGGYLTIAGKIAVGDIQAFIQYMRTFTQPLNQIAQIMNLLQSTIAAADRIFDFLDEEEIDFSAKEVIPDDKVEGAIEFEHVKFGYDENIVIKDFNLKVSPGQKIAIVGPTGAGKTTIVKLLMRFYELNHGRILLDGRDISTLELDEYRKNFAMVLQDTWLFNGTIMDNLKYGKLDATDEEVFSAARAAYADRFILTQKYGYETILSEDTKNISQGQKQLLTIARAILSNPKILILDEATSSVDTRTEEMIQNAMDNLIKDRTSFIIAHRLSTIKNADLILVLNEGDIVEQGTHDELMKNNGFYKNLYDSQYEELEEIN